MTFVQLSLAGVKSVIPLFFCFTAKPYSLFDRKNDFFTRYLSHLLFLSCFILSMPIVHCGVGKGFSAADKNKYLSRCVDLNAIL
ncbi:hypothetical protein [Neptunomonas qingdaonensis]|uniref:Uncharacterized protein n=1 Tax=Neptunomonas qingdaonensis TaxID=1045558 RepID=A0A1I2QAA4_9GAMM|nr:hypothetical protein [Neptunomonas qingdaonensis]SFG24309.1 hypothetical protein SAMN05216175_104279 [Neptunomonas qingdaonensis]